MITLFLGAGFSKWAADLPVVSQLFDFTIEPWGKREERQLDRVRELKAEWDKSHSDGPPEIFIADALSGFEPRDRNLVLWYVVRRLSNPFIWQEPYFHRRHHLMIDENRRLKIPGVVKAKEVLSGFAKFRLAGIITTNYDMLVEFALGTKGFNYGTIGEVLIGRGPYPVSQWMNPVRLTGEIPIAKLHGSVSWDPYGHYTEGRRGITGNALIVAPTPEKQPPASLLDVWELAREILETTRHLLVFGFAFNPYDEAVLNLLRSAGRSVQSVLLVNRSQTIQPAIDLFPNASVTWSPPPPDGNATIAEWTDSTGERKPPPVFGRRVC